MFPLQGPGSKLSSRILFYSPSVPAYGVVLFKSTINVGLGLAELNISDWSRTHSILFKKSFLQLFVGV